MVRSDGNSDRDQVENWRLVIEKEGAFKRSKIRMDITSGPFLDEFINET